MWTKQGLLELLQSKLQGYKMILVSNREPYIHRHVGDQVECDQPASGLTIALDPIMRACGGTWIAHGSGNADHEVVDSADRVRVPPDDPSYTLRRVWLSKQQEMRYYYGLANQGIWPLCHIVFTRPTFNDEDWAAYREVNEMFARAVLDEVDDSPTLVFIQDYHFGLLPRMLKERSSNLVIAQFWHIPWPNPEVFRGFPWREELIDGMLGNDLLGFHLRLHCQNFLDTVDSTLEAKADRERFEITRNGRSTVVRPFPISVDFDHHDFVARSRETQLEIARWRRELNVHGELIGLGIDRLDYTKGIAERLRALDLLLTRYPEYRGRLVFIQVGVPSRSRIRQYKLLEEEIEDLVEEINWKWAARNWRPIIFLGQQFPQSRLTALHLISTFCVVSSLHDGMNLVAKEFVASRVDEDGVLILSDFAGASRELKDAVIINPFNEGEIADAMRTALEMPVEERRRRMQKMREAVAENNIYRWAGKIIFALLKLDSTTIGQSDAALVEGSTR